MKVIRILVYEGDEEWMRMSLSSGNRSVLGILKAQNGKGSIREFYIQSPIELPTESPFDIEEKKKEK